MDIFHLEEESFIEKNAILSIQISESIHAAETPPDSVRLEVNAYAAVIQFKHQDKILFEVAIDMR